eukprot:854574-Pelagomonas_calceolata.AAC.4
MSEYIRKAVSEMGTEWERKRKVAYWRGGNHPPHHSSLRNRLVHLAINSSLLDARFGAYSWDKFIECKIILAVDGYGHFSNIIKRALLSGSVVARVDHKVGTGEWFEPFLIPYHNFLPIRFDLSNLQDVVQWAIENDEASRMIARNAHITYSARVRAACEGKRVMSHVCMQRLHALRKESEGACGDLRVAGCSSREWRKAYLDALW